MFYSNFEHIEDAIVWGKLLVILGELSLLPQDPVAWDYGPHRLYQVMVVTDNNNPFRLMEKRFCNRLAHINTGSTVNPELYSTEDYIYPDFTRTFLTVYV